MLVFLSLLSLLLASFLLGRVLLGWLGRSRPLLRASLIESLLAPLALGIMLNGWLVLLLAELGIFRVAWLSIFDGVVVAIGLWKFGWPQLTVNNDAESQSAKGPQRAAPLPAWAEAAVLIAWGGIALILFFSAA